MRCALATAFAAAALSANAAAPVLAQEQPPAPAPTVIALGGPHRPALAADYSGNAVARLGEAAATTEPIGRQSSGDLRVGMALIFSAIAAGSFGIIVNRRRRDTRDEPEPSPGE